MRFKDVLVAADGSEFAAHALAVATTVAAESGAQIDLVHLKAALMKCVGLQT